MAAEQTSAITQACPNCGEILDTTNAEPLSRVECPKCGEKVRVERAFDNFVLVETLGIGGMGTVYKARDTLLERDVALKLLRTDLGGEIDQTKRLQQEARVAASVNSPNVIQVFSSGIDHGQFYLVMELVDKGSLDDRIEEQKKLPEEFVLETGIQAAKGLRAAYGKGLVHRDVKPANILFSDEHTAKIGDFGLAGVAAEEAENRGEIWGTPYYVAPERLKNEPEDFRSDIYSLGATLFHALSGTAPIEGETNSATALHELKIHPMDLRTLVPDVSGETVKVFRKMISPEPAERYSSYDELVIALERAYGELTGSGEYVGRKRRRRLLIGLAILLAALIGVGTWAWISHQRSARELNAAAEKTARVAAVAPLEGRMLEAVRELSQVGYETKQAKSKKSEQAREAFARIAVDAQKKQPIYDWARFQQGLAAMVGLEASHARNAFQDVDSTSNAGFPPDQADLAAFFQETSRKLSSPGVIPPGTTLNATNYQALAMFAFGLKNIGELAADDAIPYLEQFMKSEPGGNVSWITSYKTLADRFLADCKLYREWEQEGRNAKDPASLDRHVASTSEIIDKKKFRMHSRMEETVKTSRDGLKSQKVALEKAEIANREQEKNKQAQQIAQTFAQKKPQWIANWKAKLIDDLNRSHYSGAITDIGGVQYTGITGANQNAITMQTPYGALPLTWANLAPKTLLDVSASFAKPGAPDTADRQWLCAVFAAETKQTDAAKKLADEAAKTKAEYKDFAPLLIPQ